MIILLNHRNETTANDIIGVQLPAYRVEAALIEFDGIPALQDTTESLMTSNETFVGCLEEKTGRLAGVISYEIGDEEVDICRLVVHPDYFRRGIATRLLQYVLQHAAVGRVTVVSTGSRNEPAIALYKRHGFNKVGSVEVAPGFLISNLMRNA